ncbi:MAG: hypothetical protein JO214_17615 [Frankiaceae bacterium]|nr:hypothetical protein [Frankiaceae bacterium]
MTIHLAMLGLALTALVGAGVRIASALVDSLATRVLGAMTLVAGFAIAEPLLIGLTGQGANSTLLTGAAVLTWLAARLSIETAPVPVRQQLADEWTAASAVTRAAVGAFAGFVVGTTIWQTNRPRIGWDGTVYHAAQPAVWIGTGHPGALHQTLANFPTQAYPKSFEMLEFWTMAIGRSLIVLTPLMMTFYVVLVAAMLIGLRRARVPAPLAALAVAAAVLIPWNLIEFDQVYNDVAALAFLAVTVALCQGADREPRAAGLAVVAAGLAIGVKTTTVPIALVALLWLAWRIRADLRRQLRTLLPLGSFGIGLGVLWYVENAVTYHAPFWPFSRFPAGPQEPYLWREFGNRLLAEPAATYRAVGFHNYLHYLGGVPILIVGAVVVAGIGLAIADRADRRFLVVGAAVVVLQTLLWSAAQFTGIAHGVVILVLSAQRYLDAAPFAATIVLAVAARRPGALRWIATALLGAALVVDLYVGGHEHLAAGRVPPAAIWVALLAAGAVGGVLSTYSARTIAAGRSAVALPIAAVGGACLLAIPASSYLDHYLAQPTKLLDGPVLRYLQTQPGWVHGDAPVAAGSGAHVTWAGPQLTHPLTYVPATEPCTQLRAQATSGWLILLPQRGGAFSPLSYPLRLDCLAGLTPVKTLPGKPGEEPTLIYAPPALVG